jgi:hypothetical protein
MRVNRHLVVNLATAFTAMVGSEALASGVIPDVNLDMCLSLVSQGERVDGDLAIDSKRQILYTLKEINTSYQSADKYIVVTDMDGEADAERINLTSEISGNNSKDFIKLDALDVDPSGDMLFVAGSIFTDIESDGSGMERFVVATLDITDDEPKPLYISEIMAVEREDVKAERVMGFWGVKYDYETNTVLALISDDNEGGVVSYASVDPLTGSVTLMEVPEADGEAFDAVSKDRYDYELADFDYDADKERLYLIQNNKKHDNEIVVIDYSNSDPSATTFDVPSNVALESLVVDRTSDKLFAAGSKILDGNMEDGGKKETVIFKMDADDGDIRDRESFYETDFSEKYFYSVNDLEITEDGETLVASIYGGGDLPDEFFYSIDADDLDVTHLGDRQDCSRPATH